MERLRAAGPRAGRRPRRRQPPRRRRGGRLDRDRRGQPGAGGWRASAGLAVLHRGELLAELCAEKRLIAVAGTHGKTTTTAMMAWALRALGADPAFFVGGEVPGLGPDGASGQRRLGRGGVGRRRGRRERRQLPRAEPGDRRDHQRRDGPPLALGLGRRAARGVRRLRGEADGAWRRRATRLASSPSGGPTRGSCGVRRRRARPGRARRWRSPVATTCSTRAPRWRPSSSPASTSRRRPRRSPTSRASGAGSS